MVDRRKGLVALAPLTHNLSMNRKASFWVIALALSASVLAGCFIMGTPARRTDQAYVALSGQEPFGPLNAPSPDPPDTVVLYRTGRDGATFCYNAFYSEELHKALLPKDGKQVTVVYDTFSDFGKVTGYNVHSVDGIVLANWLHVLKPEFAAIAGVARRGPGTASGDACW